MTKKDNVSTRLIRQQVSKFSSQLPNFFHISSFEALTEIIRTGGGIAFQRPWAMRKDWSEHDFTFRRADCLGLRRNWFCAWSAHVTDDAAIQDMLNLIQTSSRRLAVRLRDFECRTVPLNLPKAH